MQLLALPALGWGWRRVPAAAGTQAASLWTCSAACRRPCQAPLCSPLPCARLRRSGIDAHSVDPGSSASLSRWTVVAHQMCASQRPLFLYMVTPMKGLDLHQAHMGASKGMKPLTPWVAQHHTASAAWCW